jgi:tetratricopeptide (TPR) repeat protein
VRTTKEAVAPQPGTVNTARQATPAPSAGDRLLEWIGKHRQASTYGAVVIVAVVGFLVWNISARGRTESEARSALSNARVAFESRNLGLASSELSRVRENYAGTKAAEEATLLLAQVRLLQGQADQGLQLLQDLAPDASVDYRSKAFGLLGAALENAGRVTEAAQAYERAGNAEELPFLKTQYLSEAGRAWAAAGDTARAVSIYRRIVSELGTAGGATEAQVRLGELTKGVSTP